MTSPEPAALATAPIQSVRPAQPRERLRECPHCGLFQHMPSLPRGSAARCQRCNAVLRRRCTDPTGRGLALATTGLLLFALATQLSFLDLSVRGLDRATTLVSGPVELEQHGMWEIAIVVLVTTIAAPALKLAATMWVLLGLRLRNPPAYLHIVFRWVEWLGPWSMIEVFLLGVFVAYTKLIDLAHVEVGGAIYALGALMLAMAAMDSVIDREAVWDRLEQRGETPEPVPDIVGGNVVGCHCCGIVVPMCESCPRCGSRLRHRKTNSVNRTWALLAAATVLYIPANVLPVMTVIRLGQGSPNTILSGVEELAASGMWPLAALVFVASITVPVLKLVGLVVLLVSTRRGARTRLRERTFLYRVIDSIGRWSMIDVFMISILTAVVRMGSIASVFPGPGVLSFCAVVIITIFAAQGFDPRLMWDAAAASKARAAAPAGKRPVELPA